MPNNELQEILGARFKDHTHSTNESVWSAIESQLDAEKSDRAGFWFWILNGLTATLFIGLMIESTMNVHPNSESLKSQVKTETNQQEVKDKQFQNQLEVSEDKNSSFIGSTKINESLSEESLPSESFSRKSLSLESEIIRINEKEDEILNAKDLSNKQNRNNASQTSRDLPPFLILPKIQKGDISDLHTRPLEIFSDQGEISNFCPISTNKNSRKLSQKFPVHLGMEISYLKRIHFGALEFGSNDSTNSLENSEIENNRHFEFSLFSQFDLTKRFSASVGIGYSQSQFAKKSGDASANNDPTYNKQFSQFLFTIPLQAKYTFIQKNRLMISSGLTFQGELGQVSSFTASQQYTTSTSTSTALVNQPYDLTKSRIQQFALEPFMQLSIQISPRLYAFGNLGYRWYFGKRIAGSSYPSELNYVNTDIGILIRLR